MTKPLHEFIEQLEKLEGESFINRVRRDVAMDGLRLIAAGYRTSTDPYGAAWTPLKHRNGKPLVLTGAFRDTWMAYPTPTGVRFVSGVDYGAYHQYGTRTIPFRRVIPLQSQGLPKPWVDAVAKSYNKEVKAALA